MVLLLPVIGPQLAIGVAGQRYMLSMLQLLLAVQPTPVSDSLRAAR
jgi:hypothetical protein